jgi:hypothetical protein
MPKHNPKKIKLKRPSHSINYRGLLRWHEQQGGTDHEMRAQGIMAQFRAIEKEQEKSLEEMIFDQHEKDGKITEIITNYKKQHGETDDGP